MSNFDIYTELGLACPTPSAQSLALVSFFSAPCDRLQTHVVSRQMGTTTAVSISAAVDALSKPGQVIVICPRRLANVDYYRDIIARYYGSYIHVNNRNAMIFINNSRIIFRSISVDALRGMSVHHLYVDAEICQSLTLIDMIHASMPMAYSTNGYMNVCLNASSDTEMYIKEMLQAGRTVISYPNYTKPHLMALMGKDMYERELLCKLA